MKTHKKANKEKEATIKPIGIAEHTSFFKDFHEVKCSNYIEYRGKLSDCHEYCRRKKIKLIGD